MGHLSSPADVTACVTHVGISQNTERCSSSSVSQPHTLVISPGWPDLQGLHLCSQSLRGHFLDTVPYSGHYGLKGHSTPTALLLYIVSSRHAVRRALQCQGSAVLLLLGMLS